MARSYQQDLRVRVIDAVLEKGMSGRGAAAHFGIGEATAIRWVKHFRQTGLRTPIGTGGHRPSQLRAHRDFIVSQIAEQGDVGLASGKWRAVSMLRGLPLELKRADECQR